MISVDALTVEIGGAPLFSDISFWASLTTPLMVIVPCAQVTSGLLRSIAKVSSTTLAVKYLEKYFIFVS